jgi:type VI secretion system protein ImpF
MFPAHRDRLQPTLFDRLSDDAPLVPHDIEDRRVLSRSELRDSVLRSLTSLFNAVRVDPGELGGYRLVKSSVLGYGFPSLAGQLASKVDISSVEGFMLDAIRHYEPRIIAQTLSVRAVKALTALNMQNVIEFEIRGQLRTQPVPIEILLRTQVDLEGGHINVTDVG